LLLETVMTSPTPVADSLKGLSDAYIVLGLATCFLKEEGQVYEVKIIEPLPSAALEAILKGVPTSYSMACGTTLSTVIVGDALQRPGDFPEEAQFCDDFVYRATAAARTYQSRPTAQNYIPPGTVYREFNYSTERKRVLNSTRVIRTEDNVKQHAYTHQVL
jgi:hypothetical protein